MSSSGPSANESDVSILWRHFERNGEKVNSTHWKAWCCRCVRAAIDTLRAQDEAAVQAGIPGQTVRTDDTLRSIAYATVPCISGRLKVMLNHVKHCVHYTAEERTSLEQRRASEEHQNSVSRSRTVLGNLTNFFPASSSASQQPVAVFPSDSALLNAVATPPLKRLRSETGSVSVVLQRTDTLPDASTGRDIQEEFKRDLCRLFVACNFAWKAVANAEFKAFFRKYLPHLTVPDRRTLSGPALRAEILQVQQRIRARVEKSLAMFQCDGWRNIARMPVITSMMTVANKAYLVRSHNTFGQPKTGDHLLGIMQQDLGAMEELYGVECIGVCTDDGPDGKKARRLLRAARPWLIVTVCWAHQNNLIFGDLVRSNRWLKAIFDRALDVIKWFLNHNDALSLLHEEQRSLGTFQRALMLILPIVTRWTGQYVSVARLLRLKGPLRTVCTRHEDRLLHYESRSETATQPADVISEVNSVAFWTELAEAKETIQPLAIAANVLQQAGTRPDHVLLTLGNLYRIYASAARQSVRTAVHQSLELRWNRADQEIFILAVFLNPWIRGTAFQQRVLMKNDLARMCQRIYTRLFRRAPSNAAEFWSACLRYYDARSASRFSDDRMGLSEYRSLAVQNGKEVDMVQVWQGIQCDNVIMPDEIADQEVVQLAIRIHSAIANSAACERGFSIFGITQTKVRNSLDVQSTHDIVFVRMDIQDRHAQLSARPNRLKRHFGDDGSSSSIGSASSSSSFTQSSEMGPSEEVTQAAERLLEHSRSDPTDDWIDPAFDEDDDEEDDDPAPEAPGQYRKILLADLFTYPPPSPASATPNEQQLPHGHPLEFYWHGGIKQVELDAEIHEAAAEDV